MSVGRDPVPGAAAAPIAFRGVVLAGGASRRMGRDKALIEVGGRAMARIAADALLAAGARSVSVVGGNGPALARWGLDVVADHHPGEGPLGGLLTAFAIPTATPTPTVATGTATPAGDDGHARPSEELVMVLTCDLPFVDASVVGPTVERLAGARQAAAAAPRIGGRLQLLSAAYRPALVGPHARRAFAAGERAVRAALAGLEVAEVELTAAQRRLLQDADSPDRLPPDAR